MTLATKAGFSYMSMLTKPPQDPKQYREKYMVQLHCKILIYF